MSLNLCCLRFSMSSWLADNFHHPPPHHPITCEFEGKTYKGTYWVAGRILTVATGGRGKSRQVGTMKAEELAMLLLLELVRAGRA
jgi:hypothetical protein